MQRTPFRLLLASRPVGLAARCGSGAITAIAMLLLLSPAAQAQTPSQASPDADYRIGGRDLLEIRVFEVEELESIIVRVSEEGMIRLPIVDEITAGGMTRTDLEGAIERALTRFVTDPQVSVFIREFQSQRFSIMGAVRTPGTYEMSGRTTLLEAIAQAGGINNAEAAGSVTILRSTLTGAPVNANLDQLLREGTAAYNVELSGGDVINVVPKDHYSIYVYGRVRVPGSYDVNEDITLMQAISFAGGVAERAKKTKVRIMRRRADGTQEIIQVNLEEIEDGEKPDLAIQPGDVIIVPETFF